MLFLSALLRRPRGFNFIFFTGRWRTVTTTDEATVQRKIVAQYSFHCNDIFDDDISTLTSHRQQRSADRSYVISNKWLCAFCSWVGLCGVEYFIANIIFESQFVRRKRIDTNRHIKGVGNVPSCVSVLPHRRWLGSKGADGTNSQGDRLIG